MTLKKLKEKGLKCIFFREDTEKCEKWGIIAHFKYINKENNNIIYENGVDMKIYYYSDNKCFVNIDCMKRVSGRNEYKTIQELIEHDNFFNHTFDLDEYME